MKKALFARDVIIETLNALAKNPVDLLRTDTAKMILARNRLMSSGTDLSAVDSPWQCDGGLAHNLRGLENLSAVRRVNRLPAILMAVDEIYENADSKQLLIIGPRTEMEIFAFMSWGFNLETIHALDLISYSELVTQGDMHAIPYPADSFDVIAVGWVLAYSRNTPQAMNEIVRVAKNGCVIAIGLTRTENPTAGEWQPTSDELISSLENLGVSVRPLVTVDNKLRNGMGRTIFACRIDKLDPERSAAS